MRTIDEALHLETTEFMDLKLGQSIILNGYPMELVAVGSLLVEGNHRIEIAQFQRLAEEPLTPAQNLIKVLEECGFTKAIQSDIILSAIGRRVRNVGELSDAECDTVEAAIISAMLDREQLESENP